MAHGFGIFQKTSKEYEWQGKRQISHVFTEIQPKPAGSSYYAPDNIPDGIYVLIGVFDNSNGKKSGSFTGTIAPTTLAECEKIYNRLVSAVTPPATK